MSHGNPNRPRQKRGRPRNATRDAALEAGYLFFAGKPCRYGHAGKRYTSTGACVECYKGRAVERDADEFESLFS